MSTPSPVIALLTLVLVCATFLLGIQLKLEYFVEVLRRPRALLVGTAGQFLLLPLLATAFFHLYPLRPELGVGWFILAAAPGGALSNMFTFAGGGRLSLSVVLTACSTLAAVVTVPLWVSVGQALSGGAAGQQLPVAMTLFGSFVALVVPLSLGIGIGVWKQELAERLRRPTRIAMLVMIVVSITAYTTARWDFIAAGFDPAIVAGTSMFFSILVIASWTMARASGLDRRDRFTIGIEVGIQNVVIALVLIELIDRPDLVPFMGYYGLVMFVLALLWMAFMARSSSPRAARAAQPDHRQ